MARLWRLFHPDLPDEQPSRVSLGPEESRHAWRVLRIRAGEPVAVFDGDGREWAARVVEGDPDRVTLKLERRVLDPEVDAALEVALFQALIRAERMDWVIQKATEVGVAAVHPFPSERAERYGMGESRLRRWRRIAVEASKQCGRRRLTRIEPVPALPPVEGDSTLALLLHPDPSARPLDDLCTRTYPERVWLGIGPQGGLTAAEVEQFRALGWRITEMGPRVLRAETAGLVAASIVLHRLGDLGRGGQVRPGVV